MRGWYDEKGRGEVEVHPAIVPFVGFTVAKYTSDTQAPAQPRHPPPYATTISPPIEHAEISTPGEGTFGSGAQPPFKLPPGRISMKFTSVCAAPPRLMPPI